MSIRCSPVIFLVWRVKRLNRLVVVRGARDKTGELWAARELLFCLCSVKEDTESLKVAFLQYIECVTPLDVVNETWGCLCLRRTTTHGREDESEVCRSVEENDCTVAGE